ncbi:hypothetical protein A4X03_0g8133, partial [Tilletia caries]
YRFYPQIQSKSFGHTSKLPGKKKPSLARPVAIQCPGRASCQNRRFFADLGRHLNSKHVARLAIAEATLRASGYTRCPASSCGKYFRLPPPGTAPPHVCAAGASAGRTAASRAAASRDAPPNPDEIGINADEDNSDNDSIASFTSAVERTPSVAPPAPEAADDAFAESPYQNDRPALTEDEALDVLKDVARLPAAPGMLPSYASRDFTAMMDRKAGAFLYSTNGGLKELLDIVVTPKVVLSPLRDRSLGAPTLVQRMHTEDIPVPTPLSAERTRMPRKTDLADEVHRKIGVGRLRQAAHALDRDSKLLPVNEETVSALKTKFPNRKARRFKRKGLAAPLSLQDIDADMVRKSARTFRKDTSGGIGGWTVPLLQLATKGDRFCEFVIALTRQMASGDAPGRKLLSSALLLPLSKPDGGIRPIAVGELLYRLCAKLLLKVFPLSEALLPNQLGVGTPGGVEPVIRLADLLLEGRLPDYKHITSIDLRDAFNALFREAIDDGVHQHCRDAYKFAAWRYGHEGAMFVVDGDRVEVITAEQGVQQGDPFGPFFFSVAIRNLVTRLQAFLGEECIVVFYLDDGYIFSKDAGTLERVKEFFQQQSADGTNCGLDLNTSKSVEMSREEIQAEGMSLLGSVIGSREARVQFLREEIEREAKKIDKLSSLRKQDALLLLTNCVQHDLRHLTRTLRTDDIGDAWQPLDHKLHSALRDIRDVSLRRGAHDKALFSLPAARGGCGVPRFKDLAPHARAAARQSADFFIRSSLCVAVVQPAARELEREDHESDAEEAMEEDVEWTTEEYEDGTTTEERDLLPQRLRCKQMYDQMEEKLFSRLTREEAMTVRANAWRLSRRWMTTIPFTTKTRLSDRLVQVGMHLRTLIRHPHPKCPSCGLPNEHAHDDICRSRVHHYTSRHNKVRDLFARVLRETKDTQVIVEPRVEERFGQERTDLRVAGTGAPTGSVVEFDITFTSLATKRAREWMVMEAGDLEWGKGNKAGATWSTEQYLEEQARAKVAKYLGKTSTAFKPMVFSLDGVEGQDTQDVLKFWRTVVPSFSYVLDELSVILLRTRAESFLLW